jgi:hypothetical protein
VTISLSTLSPEALSKFTETSAQQLAEHRRDIADTLQIKEDQVIAAGEYQFVEKSLIIELAPEVDLAALKLDPKAVVCPIRLLVESAFADGRLHSRLD